MSVSTVGTNGQVLSESLMSTSVEHRNGVIVVAGHGAIDMVTAPMLGRVVADVLAEDPAALVIDLSGVDFLAAAGLRILEAARTEIGESGRFAVVGQGPGVASVIRLLKLNEFLSLHETLEDALTAVAVTKMEPPPTGSIRVVHGRTGQGHHRRFRVQSPHCSNGP